MKWNGFLPEAKSIVDKYRSQCPDGFDPKNVVATIPAAIVVAGVVAAGATAYAASANSASQKAAAAANKKGVDSTNAANLEMFYAGRGADGNAILPMYGVDESGNPIEPKLFQDTINAYDASSAMSPEQQLAIYQDAMASVAPLQEGANQTAAGIFNGDLVNEALAYNQPVAQARDESVTARENASIASLRKTLGEITAIQQNKGYVGDSFATNSLKNKARMDIADRTAIDRSGANLANATDVQTIKAAGMTAKLNNLDLPYKTARQNIDLSNLPQDALLDRTARRQQLFNAFRIGTGQFQYSPLPQVQPTTSTGQIIAQGAGALANTAGNFATNKYLADQQQQNNLALINAYKYDANMAAQRGVAQPLYGPGF